MKKFCFDIIDILSVTGIVFVILKLVHKISWSWLWILAPFWIFIAFVVMICFICAIAFIFGIIITIYKDSKRNTKI